MPVSPRNPANGSPVCVTKHMRVFEVIALFPQAADIMLEYGLHCFSCHMGGTETLEEGCRVHGMGEEVIDELLDDINTAIAQAPERKWTLTVTPAAARGVAAIAESEGREGQALRIEVDDLGAFCLEFTEAPDASDRIFSCQECPDVQVCASPLTLQRVGGGTIDMRDGRFKLDLPEDGDRCCGKKHCGCDEAET